MSTSLAKLQALRRQAGVVSTPANAVPSADLRRLLRRSTALRSAPGIACTSRDRELPGTEIAPGLLLHEKTVPLDFNALPVLCGAFDRGEPIAASDVLFFDTETTGLAGGTGTRAFMVGVASYADDNRLRVRQLLIQSVAAEREMLEVLRGWALPSTILCSYNGKSYDAPLLRTRFQLARMGDPFAGLRHVDLLYPARRQFKGSFENCRLGTVERRALQIVREDDLPGSEAPAAWLTYLRGGSALNLRRVGEHNFQDVVTLAHLLPHLSYLQSAAAPVMQ